MAARQPIARTPRSASHQEALLQAVLALDTDYRFGGSDFQAGFDCSGLVAHVFRTSWGVELPRTTEGQSRLGVGVVASELMAGDLVFFNTLGRPYSHVGIYLGDGKFVHAPKTGARVRIERLDGRYWRDRFDGARRIRPPATTL